MWQQNLQSSTGRADFLQLGLSSFIGVAKQGLNLELDLHNLSLDTVLVQKEKSRMP